MSLSNEALQKVSRRSSRGPGWASTSRHEISVLTEPSAGAGDRVAGCGRATADQPGPHAGGEQAARDEAGPVDAW